MANERQFFRDINPGDVSIEGRKSNGVTADINGNTIIYAGIKPNELQKLTKEQYTGNVPIDGYTSTFIAALTSGQLPPYPEGNNNNETYFESAQVDPNKIITTTNNNNAPNCVEEFMDSSAILLNWENDNTKFGWAPYGANESGIANGELEKAQDYFLDNYWNTNNKNIDLAKYGGSNQSNPKLLISNLPPGLRVVAAQLNYSTGQWLTRILVALGPDFANAKDSNGKQLGIPYKKSINIYNDVFDYVRDKNTGVKTSEKIYNPTKNPPSGSETIVWHSDRIQLFIDQYDEIIKYYNKNKATFLEKLYQESLRYYRGFTAIKQKNETNPTTESLYKDFYVEYATKAHDLALKYKDCDPTIVLNYPLKDQQTQPQQVFTSGLPNKEINVPEPAPNAEGGFLFLDETEFDIEPVQLTEEIQYVVITQSAKILPNGNIINSNFTKTSGTGKNVKVITNIKDIALLKDKTFITEVKKIANEFDLKAEDLLKIMINESGLNPAASLYRKCLNANCSGKVEYSNTPKAGYTLFAGGLIGFIRPYAPSICDGNSIDTVITKDALTQLKYVKNFLTPLKSTLKGADAALLYMHFAIPALVKKMKNGDDSTLLAFKGVSAETVSAQNPGLATTIGKKPGDPLTIGDFRRFVNIKFNYTIPPL